MNYSTANLHKFVRLIVSPYVLNVERSVGQVVSLVILQQKFTTLRFEDNANHEPESFADVWAWDLWKIADVHHRQGLDPELTVRPILATWKNFPLDPSLTGNFKK